MNEESIYIGSDHGGFELKQKIGSFLKARGYRVVDSGPSSFDKDDDYPDYAEKVCRGVLSSRGKGILICRSGHGMTVVANKFPGIYASVCWNAESARRAKVDENMNLICLPADFASAEEAEKIVDAWLKTSFEGQERHRRRIGKIGEIEKRNMKPHTSTTT